MTDVTKAKIKKTGEIIFFSGLSLLGAFGLAKALTPKKNYISSDLNVETMSGLNRDEENEDDE